jgi:hypothetical protein
MKVYVASLVDLENTMIVGVYTTEKLAEEKLDNLMDELMDKNEDLGVYPSITEKYIDDVEEDRYL